MKVKISLFVVMLGDEPFLLLKNGELPSIFIENYDEDLKTLCESTLTFDCDYILNNVSDTYVEQGEYLHICHKILTIYSKNLIKPGIECVRLKEKASDANYYKLCKRFKLWV